MLVLDAVVQAYCSNPEGKMTKEEILNIGDECPELKLLALRAGIQPTQGSKREMERVAEGLMLALDPGPDRYGFTFTSRFIKRLHPHQRIVELFEKIDEGGRMHEHCVYPNPELAMADHDGKITETQFRDGLKADLELEECPERTQSLERTLSFNTLDIDGDGQLTLTEFMLRLTQENKVSARAWNVRVRLVWVRVRVRVRFKVRVPIGVSP